jgi:hypothetical protein
MPYGRDLLNSPLLWPINWWIRASRRFGVGPVQCAFGRAKSKRPDDRPAPAKIRPDKDAAITEFAGFGELSCRFGFDLAGALRSLAKDLTPVRTRKVDDSAAPTAG